MRLPHVERIWLLLAGLTLGAAWLGESGHAGWPLTLTVAGLIGLKGRLVIDHYMEMTTANARIRRVLYAFTLLVPLLVILSHPWGGLLRDLTRLD
jgi:hypothetical protein